MSGETEAEESGWTVDTLRADMLSRLQMLQQMLQERYETQTKAVDAAFLAQQTAMQTALAAADRAVAAALLSAEKAVGKAESAAEKRFDAVNEFRAQLSDQAATFMPRQEAESVMQRMSERMQDLSMSATSREWMSRTEATAMIERNNDRLRELTDRLNKAEGQNAGARESKTGLYAAIGALGVVMTVIVIILNVVTK